MNAEKLWKIQGWIQLIMMIFSLLRQGTNEGYLPGSAYFEYFIYSNAFGRNPRNSGD